MKKKLNDLIEFKISGEWGNDPSSSNAVKVIRTADFTNDGYLRFDNIVKRDVDLEKINQKKLQNGDIIIEKSGGSPNQPVGRVVYFEAPDENTYLSNNFTTILRANKSIFPKYLFYSLFLNHQIGKTRRYQNKTTGILNLQLERYLDEEVIVPNFNLQIQIASLLDKSYSILKKQRKLIGLIDDLQKSAFMEMFGDPSANPKKFPKGTIRDLVSSVNYGTSSKSEEKGKYVYLRMNNLTYEGHIDLSNLKYINILKKDLEKYSVKRGDLLFNRTNSKELVGKTAVYKESNEMVIAGYILRVRSNEKATTDYISGYLNSRHGKLILKNMSKSIVGMANINAQEFQDIKILIPPIELQEQYTKIVEKVLSIRRLTLSKSNPITNNLFKALLNKAFVDGKLPIDSSRAFEYIVSEKGIEDLLKDKKQLSFLINRLNEQDFHSRDAYEQSVELLFDLMDKGKLSVEQVFNKRVRSIKLQLN